MQWTSGSATAEQMRRELELLEADNQLKAVQLNGVSRALAHQQASIIFTDLHGRDVGLLGVMPKFSSAGTADHKMGVPGSTALPTDPAEKLRLLRQRAVESGARVRGEVPCIVDRTELLMDVLSNGVRDSSGHIVGSVTLLMDMSRHRAVEEKVQQLHRELKARVAQLQLMNDSLEKATHAKSDFLATMSHEIRSPMNGVVGMATLLGESEGLSATQLEFVSTIRNSGTALLTVINDILDYSRLESGREALKFERATMDMRHLVLGVIESLAPRATENHDSLHASIAGDVPRALVGDPLRIAQVLKHVVGNAIKFTRGGRVDVRVTVIDGKQFAEHAPPESRLQQLQQAAKKQQQLAALGLGVATPKQQDFKLLHQQQPHALQQFNVVMQTDHLPTPMLHKSYSFSTSALSSSTLPTTSPSQRGSSASRRKGALSPLAAFPPPGALATTTSDGSGSGSSSGGSSATPGGGDNCLCGKPGCPQCFSPPSTSRRASRLPSLGSSTHQQPQHPPPLHSDSPVYLRVSVTDSGIGIDEEAKGRLFKLFSQGDSSATRKFGGTGLGLAICKRVCELMGGFIGCVSLPREGSTFYFDIPMEVGDVAAISPPGSQIRPRAHTQSSQAFEMDTADESEPSAVRPRSSLVFSASAAAAAAAAASGSAASELDDDVTMGVPGATRSLASMGFGGTGGGSDSKRTAQPMQLSVSMSASMPPPQQQQLGQMQQSILSGGLSGGGGGSGLLPPVKAAPRAGRSSLSSALGLAGSAAAAAAASGSVTSAAVAVAAASSARDPWDPVRTKTRVLVAEDNLVNQKVVLRMLARLGWQCDIVSDGHEAVNAVLNDKEHRYGIILMDSHMREMDGAQACEHIRNFERGAYDPHERPRQHLLSTDSMPGFSLPGLSMDEVEAPLLPATPQPFGGFGFGSSSGSHGSPRALSSHASVQQGGSGSAAPVTSASAAGSLGLGLGAKGKMLLRKDSSGASTPTLLMPLVHGNHSSERGDKVPRPLGLSGLSTRSDRSDSGGGGGSGGSGGRSAGSRLLLPLSAAQAPAPGSRIPLFIVALSGDLAGGARERLLFSGMNTVLGKPIEQEQLRRTLREFSSWYLRQVGGGSNGGSGGGFGGKDDSKADGPHGAEKRPRTPSHQASAYDAAPLLEGETPRKRYLSQNLHAALRTQQLLLSSAGDGAGGGAFGGAFGGGGYGGAVAWPGGSGAGAGSSAGGGQLVSGGNTSFGDLSATAGSTGFHGGMPLPAFRADKVEVSCACAIL